MSDTRRAWGNDPHDNSISWEWDIMGHCDDADETVYGMVEKTAMRTLLRRRGVTSVCSRCHGLGTVAYSSGATWRGGMGVAQITYDLCDKCWGSGDEQRHFQNVRAAEKTHEQDICAACIRWLGEQIGVGDEVMRLRINEVADIVANVPRGASERYRLLSMERLLRRLGSDP